MTLDDDELYPFEIDGFQREAIDAFDADESVLVAAPTGAGKTLIAEHAIRVTLRRNQITFYTSPIKALANQKFRDFSAMFGAENVGLLTGDVTLRSDASVVVMTTEVLRNMLYEQGPRLRRLAVVVLDEVHYLQDRQRGPVWEEVLLNLPPHVRTVSLSATVSNVEEFAEWLRGVRGPTTLIQQQKRPVPLTHMLGVGDREKRRTHVVPLLSGTKLANEAKEFRRQPKPSKNKGDNQGRSRQNRGGRRGGSARGGSRRGGSTKRRWMPPRRTNLIRELVAQQRAPLIWFIFSRAGCDEALEQCLSGGLGWTDDAQQARLREILQERTAEIDDDAWYSLGLDRWQDAFEAGIASHHAGLVPAVKEAVEVAFAEGLITVVFATETLALGVNLPARTVVLERLIKYDGTDHRILTPMQFTQLTGRAGRRGKDTEGTAVSCWNTRVTVEEIAALAASQDYPLRSAFAPNYNMVANLINRSDEEAARRFVSRSYAQFQTDRAAVQRQGELIALERNIAKARDAARCDRGDVEDFLAQRSAHLADDDDLGQLRPGDVLRHASGTVVLSVAHRSGGIVVRLADRQGRRSDVRSGQLVAPIVVEGTSQLPPGLGPNDDEALQWARQELEDHWPVVGSGIEQCPDFESHVSALSEVTKLEGRLDHHRRRERRRAGALERRFDNVAELLHATDFAHEWNLTAKGELLTQVHGETEIVVAEAIDSGLLEALDAPSLAAALSALVYESRALELPGFRWPNKQVRRTVTDLVAIASRYRSLERDALGDCLTREPDAAMVDLVFRWATGEPLDALLPDEMTGGDWVRSMRQLIDLCRQVATATSGALSETATDAVWCIDHGVVKSRRDLFLIEEDDEYDEDAEGDGRQTSDAADGD